jgi:hypothetical protein
VVAVATEQLVEPDGTPVDAMVVLTTARDEVVS